MSPSLCQSAPPESEVVAGTAAEMVCPGGEYAFVECMVQDSLRLRGRIHWYTTMLGRKASLKRLRTRLHASGVSALRTTEFIQVSPHNSGTVGFCWLLTAKR